MANTVEYRLSGSFSPFFVTLRLNSITGTIVDSAVVPLENTIYQFTGVPAGSYYLVVYDRALGVKESTVLNVV